jgi:hypothetical protein
MRNGDCTMPKKNIHVKGVDSDIWTAFICALSEHEGQRRGNTGHYVSQGLQMITNVLNNEQQRTISASRHTTRPRSKLGASRINKAIDAIREHMRREDLREITKPVFKEEIIKIFGSKDKRTIDNYWRLMVDDGLIHHKGYSVYSIDQVWLKRDAPREIAEAPTIGADRRLDLN